MQTILLETKHVKAQNSLQSKSNPCQQLTVNVTAYKDFSPRGKQIDDLASKTNSKMKQT